MAYRVSRNKFYLNRLLRFNLISNGELIKILPSVFLSLQRSLLRVNPTPCSVSDGIPDAVVASAATSALSDPLRPSSDASLTPCLYPRICLSPRRLNLVTLMNDQMHDPVYSGGVHVPVVVHLPSSPAAGLTPKTHLAGRRQRLARPPISLILTLPLTFIFSTTSPPMPFRITSPSTIVQHTHCRSYFVEPSSSPRPPKLLAPRYAPRPPHDFEGLCFKEGLRGTCKKIAVWTVNMSLLRPQVRQPDLARVFVCELTLIHGLGGDVTVCYS